MSYYLGSFLNQGWDRTFLNLSSKMTEPFCVAWHLWRFRLVAPLDPQKFENSTTQAKEIATRVLLGLGAVLGGLVMYAIPVPMFCSIAVLGVGRKVFRAIGVALQEGGYTHIRGTTLEKALNDQNPQVKVMSWNICGFGGGMSLNHGGVVHWRYRLNAIVDKIKAEGPDVLILQEVYDTALAEALIERLQLDYDHFFTHLGPNVWGISGGCMVVSKCPVHDFSYTSFANNNWTINRGFAILEVKGTSQDSEPCVRIVGTHLIHGDTPEDKTNRKDQVVQIVNDVARKTFAVVPTILAGDLNMERDQEDGKLLSFYFQHGYQDNKFTCTNQLNSQWYSKGVNDPEDEIIDYISLFKRHLENGTCISTVVDKNITLKNCHLVEAYDEFYDTKTALSDHQGISVVIEGILQAQVLQGV